MRIHRLRVERVKGVDASELTFPETGVVVIEGPNEVGKSTLLEALDRLLDPKAKASSRAASITSLQPVGQDVGPYVEAELTIGPYRLIFAKQWLKQAATTLHILQPLPEQLTGQDAQARMTSIVDECLDRTLFDALRLVQAGSPGAIELRESAVLEAALDAAAGAALHADEGAALLEGVEREYQRYYTATTGRVSGELKQAQIAVTEAEHRHEQAQHELREVEAVFRRREDLAQQMTAAEQAARAASARQRTATAALDELTDLRAREETEQQGLRNAEQMHRRAEQDVQARRSLVDDAAARAAQAGQCQQQITELATRQDRAAQDLAASEAALQDSRTALADAQEQADAASAYLRRIRELALVAELAQRLEAAESATADLGKARAELATCTVTADILGELRRSEGELNVARARVEASATSVRVSAVAPGHTVEIGDGVQALEPGRGVIERLISSDTSVLVDAGVCIEIRPDAGAKEHVFHRDTLARALAERMTEVGVADLAEAEVRAERRSQVVVDIADLERELTAALRGEQLSDLQEAYAVSLERHGSVVELSEHPQDADSDVTQAAARAESTRLAVSRCSHARDDAQAVLDGARFQSAQATAAYRVMQAHQDSADAERERSAGVLASARVIAGDDELVERVRRAQASQGSAYEAVAQIRAALAAEGAQAREEEAGEAAAESTRVTSYLAALREEFFEVKGRLEQVAAEGRQEAAERADQALSDARRHHSSVERRAVAAYRLRSTLHRHRDRAHESYAQPYARQIEVLGREVYGSSFGVTVSADLVMTHRTLHGDTVPFDSLSGGAKEQLGILARVAVAALVADEQMMPVVVDDALGYTDPQRLHALGAVLASGSSQGQLLLLTCTPDRYATIPGAHTIRMTA
ncbi:MAG: AAA family ATPase [Ornithinimicrobium sp.]